MTEKMYEELKEALLKAGMEANRFAVVYELCSENKQKDLAAYSQVFSYFVTNFVS